MHFFTLDEFAGHEIETILEDGEHDLACIPRSYCRSVALRCSALLSATDAAALLLLLLLCC